MQIPAIVSDYFKAWNAHDPAAVVATFHPDGTYTDPTVPPISGDKIGVMVENIIDNFPDLRFDIGELSLSESGQVAAQWVMNGTNTGPLQGLPPTGNTIQLPGADFFEVKDGRLQSVTGYFDQNLFMSQLGFAVNIQPPDAEPLLFGNSVLLRSDKHIKPGAISVTWIEGNDEEDMSRTSAYTQQIAQEMPSMAGFLGVFLNTAGRRGYTITAWEDVENPRQLLRDGAHKEAMRWFYSEDKASRAMTSVWKLHYAHILLHCPQCGRMINADELPFSCECGQEVTEQPRYF